MRKARIENGIVREVLEADPFPSFHASLVWMECGSDVRPGWTVDGQSFAAPTIQPAPDQTPENIAALWQAAHDYEYSEISGSAVGLLVLGLLLGLPKCTAVRAWINSIWDLYYIRKGLVTSEWVPELYDFSVCGSIPHTVPELMEEGAQAKLF